MAGGCAATSDADWSNGSLRSCNGNVGSWCAGNSMLEISWALSNLQPFLSC
jgi:hypothetical protein